MNYINLLTNPQTTSLSENLLPSFYVMLGAWISIFIMFGLVSYFLYTPLKENVEARRMKIKTDIDSAEILNKEASEDRIKAEKELKNVKAEAKQILTNSKSQADSERSEIIETAKTKADSMLEEARTQGKREVEQAKAAAEAEIANIAIMAAEKLIEKELDESTNTKLVEELISSIK